jgi:hypothetical protein
MDQKYQRWINDHKREHGVDGLVNRCCISSQEMKDAFPELLIIKGHVENLEVGRQEHWWCETIDGTIVDPTVVQFVAPEKLEYFPFKPGDIIRVGKCAYCCDDINKPVQTLDGPFEHFCDDYCYHQWLFSHQYVA